MDIEAQQNFLLTRRRALQGFAAIGVTSQAGCLHLLLRLFVGRGAASLLGRSIGVRAAGTFGRGVAVGTSLTRATAARTATGSALRVPQAQILRHNGKQIATTAEVSGGTVTRMKGTDVLFSRRRGRKHDHEASQGGTIGRSYDHGDYIEHQNRDGFTQAYDRIRFARKVVEHFDRDQKSIGETPLVEETQRIYLDVDENVLKSYESLAEFNGLHCPDTKRALDNLHAYRRTCGSDCRGAAAREQRYMELLNACRRRDR